jgi:hypothetical protein
LEENPAKHPIIILKDVPFQHLTAILEFMYAGEVNVAQGCHITQQSDFFFVSTADIENFFKPIRYLWLWSSVDSLSDVQGALRAEICETALLFKIRYRYL